MTAKTQLRGFTLIELLVVVAIIALLASILMPTLQKAQEMARMVQCASQLRHVGSGYEMYANENNDYIISTCIPDGVPNTWFGQAEVTRSMLMPYMSVSAKVWTPESGVNRDNPVFCCPTASKKMDTSGSPWTQSGAPLWDSTGPSIIYGPGAAYGDLPSMQQWYYYKGSKQRIYPRTFEMLRWSAETAGIADTCVYGFWTIDPNTSPWTPIRYRHIGDRLNVLAGDGHMGRMSRAQGASSNPPFQCWKYR